MVPTIHYQMGGIPTNINGQVVMQKGDDNSAVVNGLYAVGECSCVSVHGANRLGTNSLLDLLVFGRAAGNHIVEFNDKHKEHKPLPADAADRTLERLNRLENATGGEYAQDVANDIRAVMQQHAARVPHAGHHGRRRGARSPRCASASARIALKDKSRVFNTARIEALEVDNLIEVRAGHHGLGRRPQGMPRRPHGRGLRAPGRRPGRAARPRRRQLDEAHALVQRRTTACPTSRSSCKPLTVDSVPPKVRTF